MNPVALVAVKAFFGASLALGFALAPAATAKADTVSDDDPSWSCVDQGNRVCGPGNTSGAPAGCYDDGGVMFKAWPCEAWKPSDGYIHGDGSITDASGEVIAYRI